MTLTLHNRLEAELSIAWFTLENVAVVERRPGLEAAVERRVAELRAQYDTPAAAASILGPARSLYRRLGIDPSRRRPSSEALLRRVIQGKGLYTVNTAVDAANLTSLTHFLPVGLYDRARIVAPTGEITLRLGNEGEEYAGIGKGMIHVANRAALVDDEGPFGNPSSDSFRTRVTLETKHLLFVLFGPVGELALEKQCDRSRDTLRRFVGGEPAS